MLKEKLMKPVNYIRSFVKDESGAELLEIAVGILLAVILIATVAGIVNMINGGLQGSESKIVDAFDDAEINLNSTPD